MVISVTRKSAVSGFGLVPVRNEGEGFAEEVDHLFSGYPVLWYPGMPNHSSCDSVPVKGSIGDPQVLYMDGIRPELRAQNHCTRIW